MQTRSRAQPRSGDDKETETGQSRFPAHRRKETGAKGSRGDEMSALQQAGFGERVRAALADDEVIQHPDIDGGQGTLQPLGDRTISGRWLGGPRGVLMRLLCPVFLCGVDDRFRHMCAVSDGRMGTKRQASGIASYPRSWQMDDCSEAGRPARPSIAWYYKDESQLSMAASSRHADLRGAAAAMGSHSFRASAFMRIVISA